MKKLLALIIIVAAVAVIAGALNREKILEKVDEKMGGMVPDTDELVAEEAAVAAAVAEPA
jgi:hypothetical protein